MGILFDETAGCPYNKMKPCEAVRRKTPCALFKFYSFTTAAGQEVQEGGCAVFWAAEMGMKAAQESRHVAAAMDKFTNMLAKANGPALENRVEQPTLVQDQRIVNSNGD